MPRLYVIACVGLLNAFLVDQAGAVANPRVLVDDHAIERDVFPDTKPRRIVVPRRRRIIGFVVVGAQEDGSADRRPLQNVRADADDRVFNRTTIEVTTLGDDGVAHVALAKTRSR